MASNIPAYGTPERAAYDKRSSDSYKIQEWVKQQLVAMIEMDNKPDRLNHFHDVHNFFLNLRSTIIDVHEGAHVHFCVECGRPEKACYMEPTSTKLKKNGLCFGCNFWAEHRATYNAQHRKGAMLVINGDGRGDAGNQHDGPGANKSFLGFGGHRWYVYQLTTGKLWTTNNMWSFGSIPKRFQPGMPDNAVLLTKEQYELASAGRGE